MKRLLSHKSWRHAAEAAIAFFGRGEECDVAGWKETSTWKQVKAVHDELRRRQSAAPEVFAESQ